jgi:hypothetical protein
MGSREDGLRCAFLSLQGLQNCSDFISHGRILIDLVLEIFKDLGIDHSCFLGGSHLVSVKGFNRVMGQEVGVKEIFATKQTGMQKRSFVISQATSIATLRYPLTATCLFYKAC